MAKYYNNRLRPTSAVAVNIPANDAEEPQASEMSEYDKHRISLLTADVEEGWASELRRYLGTMQRDVKKDTDLVEWWQVIYYNIFMIELFRELKSFE
jgi:hypothetical protein